ncbi:hypothetical protein RMATCC62417_12241 [Rhizopus microsporus]|nr:hypothetical protein RMATCC62417_12241 [Rhizopus microsporus]
MKSNYRQISLNDKAFIDVCRCLYQAKAIVCDLQSFSNTVCPALTQYSKLLNNEKLNDRTNSDILLKQVKEYLNTTFRKFTRLCKMLLYILTQMEENSAGQVKRERIDSFRTEVWQEWKMATQIKQQLIQLAQLSDTYTKSTFTDTSNNNNASSSSSSSSSSSKTTTVVTATEL